MQPETENYGFYGTKSNEQGIHPLGHTNEPNVHIRDGNNQLMGNSNYKPWYYQDSHKKRTVNKGPEGPTDVYVPAKTKCEICNNIKARTDNHDKALETLHKESGVNAQGLGMKVNVLNSAHSMLNNNVGYGAVDYIRGNVDVCVQPHLSYTHQQITNPLMKQTAWLKHQK